MFTPPVSYAIPQWCTSPLPLAYEKTYSFIVRRPKESSLVYRCLLNMGSFHVTLRAFYILRISGYFPRALKVSITSRAIVSVHFLPWLQRLQAHFLRSARNLEINTGEKFTSSRNHLVNTPQGQCCLLQLPSYLIKTKGKEILVCFKSLPLPFEHSINLERKTRWVKETAGAGGTPAIVQGQWMPI